MPDAAAGQALRQSVLGTGPGLGTAGLISASSSKISAFLSSRPFFRPAIGGGRHCRKRSEAFLRRQVFAPGPWEPLAKGCLYKRNLLDPNDNFAVFQT